MPQPTFFAVTENNQLLDGLTADLRRRFEADYRVLGATSAGKALTVLTELAGASEDVALLVADQRLTEMETVELLASAHELHIKRHVSAVQAARGAIARRGQFVTQAAMK